MLCKLDSGVENEFYVALHMAFRLRMLTVLIGGLERQKSTSTCEPRRVQASQSSSYLMVEMSMMPQILTEIKNVNCWPSMYRSMSRHQLMCSTHDECAHHLRWMVHVASTLNTFLATMVDHNLAKLSGGAFCMALLMARTGEDWRGQCVSFGVL